MTDIAILCQFYVYRGNKPLIDANKKEITVQNMDGGRLSPTDYIVVPKSGSASPNVDEISEEEFNTTKSWVTTHTI